MPCRAGTSRALGLTNELFVLGDSVVLTVLGQVAFMPVLVLAARLCPEVCCAQKPCCLSQTLQLQYIDITPFCMCPCLSLAWPSAAARMCRDVSDTLNPMRHAYANPVSGPPNSTADWRACTCQLSSGAAHLSIWFQVHVILSVSSCIQYCYITSRPSVLQVEATLFATLMSMLNGGAFVGIPF